MLLNVYLYQSYYRHLYKVAHEMLKPKLLNYEYMARKYFFTYNHLTIK